jgi:hypothetical protein
LRVTTSVGAGVASFVAGDFGGCFDERSLAIECLSQTAGQFQNILRAMLGRLHECAANDYSVGELADTARLLRG